MQSIYLYGCGGHGKVILDVLQRQGRSVAAFVDGNPSPQSTHIYNVPIYSAD